MSSATHLQEKALHFIEHNPYFSRLRSQGVLYFTGSYCLKTMTWPDIDMQLCLQDNVSHEQVLSLLASELIFSKNAKKIQLINFVVHPRKNMPSGRYLGVSYYDDNISDYWKLDLWILEPSDFAKNRSLLETLQRRMTPEKHALIMRIKQAWVNTYGRSPRMGSHFLYQAVILKELSTDEDIDYYLCSQGVELSREGSGCKIHR